MDQTIVLLGMIRIGCLSWRIQSICRLVLGWYISYLWELVQLGRVGIDNIVVEAIESHRFCYIVGWQFGIDLDWLQVVRLGSFGID